MKIWLAVQTQSVSQGDLEEAVLLVTDEAAAAEKKALFGNVETKGGR